MNILTLVLTHKWFDAIASGYKREEYREIKPYYISRLCEDVKVCLCEQDVDKHPSFKIDGVWFSCSLKQYDMIRFRRGYTSTVLDVECEGIGISKGEKEWGYWGDQDIFVIKLGKPIKS